MRQKPYRTGDLVPELPGEIPTTGGLDYAQSEAIQIRRLKNENIAVSLFIDPAEEQIRAVLALGANTVQLNTTRYSDLNLTNRSTKEGIEALDEVRHAAEFAHSNKMQVLAGHA